MIETKVRPWQAVQIRVAQNAHGSEIKQLLKDNGVYDSILDTSWDDIFPFWLISTVGNEIVGCVQMIAAKPYGYLEFLCIKPGVSNGVRVVSVKKLLLTGCQQLRALGSAFAIGTVQAKSFKTVLKNNGCVIGPQCNITVKRLFGE